MWVNIKWIWDRGVLNIRNHQLELYIICCCCCYSALHIVRRGICLRVLQFSRAINPECFIVAKLLHNFLHSFPVSQRCVSFRLTTNHFMRVISRLLRVRSLKMMTIFLLPLSAICLWCEKWPLGSQAPHRSIGQSMLHAAQPISPKCKNVIA